MTIVELLRADQDNEATIGRLYVEGEEVCYTLEEPWRDNKPDVSCIPTGIYPLELEFSPSKGCKLWTIKNVPGRKYVRIHIGNTVDDTEGCPLTGTNPGTLGGKKAVLGSTAAFHKFMDAMKGTIEAQIHVRNK